MDPNTFYLDPCPDMDPGFWPNLDPYPDHEPGLTYQFLKKTLNKILKGIFFKHSFLQGWPIILFTRLQRSCVLSRSL